MIEEWKEIKGFPGYEVSNLGKVRSYKYKKPRILKPCTNISGYLHVALCNKGKLHPKKVTWLVWDAFGDRPRNGRKLQVDHKDENKQNNRIDNLQLLTNRENVTKHFQAKRSLPTGVYLKKRTNKYFSAIYHNGRTKRLGTYHTPQEAGEAYQKALEEIRCL